MKEAHKDSERQRIQAEVAEKREDAAAVASLRQEWVELGGGDDEFDALLAPAEPEAPAA